MHITSSTSSHRHFDLPHPDHTLFNLILSGVGAFGILYLFPPSLWDTRPDLHSPLLIAWGFALLIVIGTALRTQSRVQMTPTEFININILTNRKKSVRLDEIQRYSLKRVSKKSFALLLQVTTRQGESIRFTFHEDFEEAFIAEMDRRRSSGVYREA